MKKDDIFPSSYVKAADIEGREIAVVIASTKMEKLGDDNKLVVYFQNATKGLVCNVTNFDRIAYICGSEETDDWPGHEIVLFTELATFQGKTGPAVRVKAPLKRGNGPTTPKLTDPTPNTFGVNRANPPRSADADMGGDEIPF